MMQWCIQNLAREGGMAIGVHVDCGMQAYNGGLAEAETHLASERSTQKTRYLCCLAIPPWSATLWWWVLCTDDPDDF